MSPNASTATGGAASWLLDDPRHIANDTKKNKNKSWEAESEPSKPASKPPMNSKGHSSLHDSKRPHGIGGKGNDSDSEPDENGRSSGPTDAQRQNERFNAAVQDNQQAFAQKAQGKGFIAPEFSQGKASAPKF